MCVTKFAAFTQYSCDYIRTVVAILNKLNPLLVIVIILAVCEFVRHELPVTTETIEVLADTDELLVVNKPSSIPIHPCGRYRFNCLLFILAKENGLRNLRGK